MFDQRQEIIEGSRQLPILFRALLDQLCMERRGLSLDGPIRRCGLNRVKSQSQIVKGFLLEALVLGEDCEYFGRDHLHKWLDEVEKANKGVSVSVQQLHVVDDL